MNVFNIKEIQLGLIILILTYFSFFFSGVDLNMKFSHRFVIAMLFAILFILMFNLRILVQTPHRGLLVLTHKHDTWFVSTFKMIFFIIFFTVASILVGLIADAMHLDRSQDIFLLSMFVANIYYLIVSLWVSYNFINMSTIGDNMEYDESINNIKE